MFNWCQLSLFNPSVQLVDGIIFDNLQDWFDRYLFETTGAVVAFDSLLLPRQFTTTKFYYQKLTNHSHTGHGLGWTYLRQPHGVVTRSLLIISTPVCWWLSFFMASLSAAASWVPSACQFVLCYCADVGCSIFWRLRHPLWLLMDLFMLLTWSDIFMSVQNGYSLYVAWMLLTCNLYAVHKIRLELSIWNDV